MLDSALQLFESLPLFATTSIVAAMSATLLFALSCLGKGPWLWVAAFLVPFAVSYCSYWAPVWRGADSSEYSAWAPLVIGAWFAVAALACVALLLILRGRRPDRGKHG